MKIIDGRIVGCDYVEIYRCPLCDRRNICDIYDLVYKEEKKKINRYILDLDDLFEGFPNCSYDVGGLGHYIIVESINLPNAIEDMTQEYRELLIQQFMLEDEEDE